MPLRFSTCFVIILGVTEISCSFRLVLEVKAGKGIPESSRLEFLEKFLTSNFHLSDAEGNNSRPLDRRVLADLSSLRILLTICQKSYWSFVSIWKFGNFKNTFATISYLSELYIWFRRFILFVEMKKVISMNCGSITSSWTPCGWMRHGLIFMMRDTSIPTWTHSQSFLAAAEALNLKISSHGLSFKWSW